MASPLARADALAATIATQIRAQPGQQAHYLIVFNHAIHRNRRT
jgi:hypothetical protein